MVQDKTNEKNEALEKFRAKCSEEIELRKNMSELMDRYEKLRQEGTKVKAGGNNQAKKLEVRIAELEQDKISLNSQINRLDKEKQEMQRVH